MPTSKPLRRLAADANVILSAVAGKAALRVFLKEDIEIETTDFNIAEVREYLHIIAEQYELSEEVLESQLRLLPLKIYPHNFYDHLIPAAAERLSGLDNDDTELLALALKLSVPVWSNDNVFKRAGVETYTTAKLLKILKV